MALKVEGVLNGGMHAEETLSGSNRFEPLHLALSSPHAGFKVDLVKAPYAGREMSSVRRLTAILAADVAEPRAPTITDDHRGSSWLP
jgi:hypothetical protein